MKTLKMYAEKPRKVVDPNAPPRPTLLGHEKVIKDTKSVIAAQAQEIAELKTRLSELESRVRNQGNYLTAVHQQIRKS
jgi:hypothetical protein